MICSQCGKNNPDDARFCDGCGNTLQAAPVNQGYTAPPPPPPPQYQQPQYQQSYQQSGYTPAVDNSPLSVGQYIGMYLLQIIPVVGFILLLVWAFSGDTNINKKNWARAMLIIMLIGIVLAIIFSVAFAGLIASLMGSMSYY
ncbi:MAG: zinc ribbon domain-containing protein [Clostridiaceae bacterium]|nr:zinc ribbon domain-containing protein [Clostridiaceae bacterium]